MQMLHCYGEMFMKYFDYIGVIALIIIVISIGSVEADDKFVLNIMPRSSHHGIYDKPYLNENHNGIGVTAVKDNGFHYGLMHFTNSYNVDGFMLHGGFEFTNCPLGICPGMSLGYAPMYNLTDQIPVLPMVTFRWRWIKLITVPGVVSTFTLNVPFEAFRRLK
jgi:hypothetical protein